jgi:HEAT repeat protein
VNIMDKVLRTEQEPGQVKTVLNQIIASNIDGGLVKTLADRASCTYSDPDLGKAAAGALEALGDLTKIAPEGDQEKTRIRDEYAALVKHIFMMGAGGQLYDPGLRYDVETRKAVIKALVSTGANYGEDVVGILTEALDKDADARIRRAAADALGKVGPAAAKAIPSLQEALRKDDDSEVRTSASEAILILTRSKQQPEK